MGRKPERYKKVLAKGEPELKEIPYAPHEGVQGDEKAAPGDQRMDTGDKAAYRAWKESFIPASQEKMAVSDEELLRQHKDLQTVLDSKDRGEIRRKPINEPELKIPFWNEQERPMEDKFFISIVENSPGFMQIVSGKRDGIERREIKWLTSRPPKTATQLEKTIKLFQKGGDKEQMDLLFTRLLELFKRMDEHIVR